MKRALAALLVTLQVVPVLPLAIQRAAAATIFGASAIAVPAQTTDIVSDALPQTCPVLAAYTTADKPLPRVRAALQPGGQLNILAVGSGTVMGPDAAHPNDSFPYLMAMALKTAAPQTDVTLTIRGGKGVTAGDMLSMIDAELSAHKFQLVLWQTGTVEALKGMEAEALRAGLAAGADHVRAAGGDLILIDPQYSRFLQANTNLAPYQAAFLGAGVKPGVSVFHRFALMHEWAEHGGIDLERAAPADRQKTADLLRACLGRALARLVLDGARRSGGTLAQDGQAAAP